MGGDGCLSWKFLTLRRQLRMVPLMMMVLFQMKRIIVVWGGGAGVITGVNGVVTKDVEEVQQAVKFSSLSYFMLKSPSLLAQVSRYDKRSQDNLCNRMCNLGDQAMWRNGRIAVSSYIDVETRKY